MRCPSGRDRFLNGWGRGCWQRGLRRSPAPLALTQRGLRGSPAPLALTQPGSALLLSVTRRLSYMADLCPRAGPWSANSSSVPGGCLLKVAVVRASFDDDFHSSG